jgi:hypothetical protein
MPNKPLQGKGMEIKSVIIHKPKRLLFEEFYRTLENTMICESLCSEIREIQHSINFSQFLFNAMKSKHSYIRWNGCDERKYYCAVW